jgi:hypothetical protein
MLKRCISNLARQIALTQVGDGGRLVKAAPSVPPVDPLGIPGTSCSESGHWLYCSCGDRCKDHSRDFRHFLEDHQACGKSQ